MSAANAGAQSRWIWAAVCAVIATGLVMLVLSLARVAAPPVAAVRTKPAIELTERAAKSALDDEATLLDPKPLFMPTKWNASQKDVPPPEPGGTFQSFRFPAKPEFTDADLKLGRPDVVDSTTKPAVPAKLWTSIDLPDPVAVPQKPADALTPDAPGALAMGFGRTGASVVPLPARAAMIEITTAETGEKPLPAQVMAQVQALTAAAHPPAGRPWQTMEFVAAIDAAGLAAPLMMTTRSGADEVDAYFQNFLVRTLRLGERLAPGIYRISVGP